MSEQDRLKRWQEFNEQIIPEYKERINAIEEEKSTLDKTKRQLIRELAEKCLEFMAPDEISRFLKKVLSEIVKPDTIEDALGKENKRKYQSLPETSKPETPDIALKKNIELSTIGSESYTKPDGTEGQREYEPYEGEPEPIPSIQEVNEQAAEIALSLADEYAKKAKEQEIRLNEALKLADDKDKRIYQLEMQAGELEMTIADLKKVPPQAKDIDKTEDLQIENDNLKQTIIELQEALRANVKASGFTQASHLPKRAWIAAVNALNFYRRLNSESRTAIEHNDPWHKIEFDCAADGQLTNPSKQ